ncbi:MgtC/SapB family protein [bacterium CPR1]|nr:MgtC/SapB family protein [bacterium CPR1]
MGIDLEQLARLLLAAFLGGLIGVERERLNRAAGLRTHVLVSVGSALFTLISLFAFQGVGPVNDPARVAAQIVSGIGFLGAGTIMKHGATVRGLTTAATLWVCAGIGMAAGAGFYQGAVLSTLITLISLVTLKRVEARFGDREFTHLELTMDHGPGQLAKVQGVLELLGITLRNMDLLHEETTLLLRMTVEVPRELSKTVLLQALSDVGVTHVEL